MMSKFDDLIESVFGSLVSETVSQQQSRPPQQTPVDHSAAKSSHQAQRGDPKAAQRLRRLASTEEHIEDTLHRAAKEYQGKEKQFANNMSRQVSQMRA